MPFDRGCNNLPVTHVRVAGLRYRVEVDVNDLIKVARHDFGNLVQFVEVIALRAILLRNICGQVDRSQVAHRHLPHTISDIDVRPRPVVRPSLAFDGGKFSIALTSSGFVYSMISVHRLDDLIVPRFC